MAESPRFQSIPADQMTDQQKAVVEKLLSSPRGAVRGPFAALLRNPALADRIMQVGDIIRFDNSIPAQLREMAILMIARFWSAKYEWHAHGKIGLELGLSAEIVDAIAYAKRPANMNPDQTLVYNFVSELLIEKDISDASYQAALERFGEKVIIDLLATAGYFCFVSLVLNAVRMPIPEGGLVLPSLS